MLYSRLLELKVNGAVMNGRPNNPNPVAIEFGFHSDQWDDLDREVEEAKSHYPALLELCKRLIEQDQDSSQFEDAVRHLYGTKGYKIYTVDKLIQGIVKQVNLTLNTNPAIAYYYGSKDNIHFDVIRERQVAGENDTA
jgi:paired amphipathic helix protein Sin3a